MSDLHAKPEIGRKELRDFGFVTGLIVVVLFGVFFPWLFEKSAPLWPIITFCVLATWALLLPTSLRLVYKVWMRFGLLLSKITTPVIMGAVFFLVIAPMSLVLRLFRWDAMHRTFESKLVTYRVNSQQTDTKNLENPF